MCKLLLGFTGISDVYRSFIGNKLHLLHFFRDTYQYISTFAIAQHFEGTHSRVKFLPWEWKAIICPTKY